MAIYHTPYMQFDGTWIVLARSNITGETSFDDIVAERGEPLFRDRKFLIYGNDENREMYSHNVWFAP